MEEKKIVSKKVMIGGAVVAAIIVAIIAELIMSRETPEQKVAKLLDLGQKYLLEEDYEQAIATFDEILAITAYIWTMRSWMYQGWKRRGTVLGSFSSKQNNFCAICLIHR